MLHCSSCSISRNFPACVAPCIILPPVFSVPPAHVVSPSLIPAVPLCVVVLPTLFLHDLVFLFLPPVSPLPTTFLLQDESLLQSGRRISSHLSTAVCCNPRCYSIRPTRTGVRRLEENDCRHWRLKMRGSFDRLFGIRTITFIFYNIVLGRNL